MFQIKLEKTLADLFSAEWMQALAKQWNAEPELADVLANIHFNSAIAYGFGDDPNPMGVLVVQEGRVAILVGFWGKGEGGKKKPLTFYPLTFSPNPMPS
ncbi:hypothetical protein RRG12_29830 [Nostoc sp. CALU 546]